MRLIWESLLHYQKKSDELDKKEDVAKTEVNKQSLIELIEKIKNIDLSKKTIDSVEKLNTFFVCAHNN